MTKRSFTDSKEMTKEGILEHQERIKYNENEIWVNTTDFPYPLEFSKVCLTIEANIIISDVALNICRGVI